MRALRFALPFLVLTTVAPALAQVPSPFSRLTGYREAERLRSADDAVQLEAARTLGRWGERRRAVQVLAAALAGENDPAVRAEIIRSLARRGDPAAVPALVQALSSSRTGDHIAVVRALGAFDNEAALRALMFALGQPELEVVARASLVRLGPRAVPHALRGLRSPSLRIAAIRALGAIGDTRATAPLVGLTNDEDEVVRREAVRALGSIGDPRASRAVIARLGDDSAAVVLSAIVALERVGEPHHATLILERVQEGTLEQRRAALRTLTAIDPAMGTRVIASALAQAEHVLAPTAVERVLEMTHPDTVPIHYGLIREGTHREEAASALAQAGGGTGLPVLLEVATEDGPAAESALRELAVAARLHEATLSGSRLDQVHALLRERTSGRRGLLLRAIARDPLVAEQAVRLLQADDPLDRATAATALSYGEHVEAGAALADILEDEGHPEAFRREAEAAVALGLEIPLRSLWSRLQTPAVAYEAMILAAASIGTADRRDRDRLRELLRRRLRAPSPRLRVGAALALATAGDRASWRALAVALDDEAREVRHAAARALASLGVGDAHPPLEARVRIEEDPVVTDALLDAIETADARRRTAGMRGDQILRVRIVAATEEGRRGVPVDAVLADGRWLRTRTLPSGELLLVDLPSSTVDVRVRVGD